MNGAAIIIEQYLNNERKVLLFLLYFFMNLQYSYQSENQFFNVAHYLIFNFFYVLSIFI